MKDIVQTEELDVPEGVTIEIKSRLITVTGPRGTLKKNVRHVQMDIQLVQGKTGKVSLAVWGGGRKHNACLRTIRSLINNMVIGVTKGFQYKMRAVYAHFPINCIIQESGAALEIRNFLGEKVLSCNRFSGLASCSIMIGRLCGMSRCLRASPSTSQKPRRMSSSSKGPTFKTFRNLVRSYNLKSWDLTNGSPAASIQGICRVRNKDIRKFLDGIYVSERGTIQQE